MLNGRVIIREGDPIDLDGNGEFDDDVFIGRGDNTLSAFAPNDIFLGDDLVLFFTAPLRNAAGEDLGSDPPFGSGGDAFMRVYLSCLTQQGDFDSDGDVDVDDFEDFLRCFAGPGGALDPGCECFDFNDDDDVDFGDFAALQQAFTG
jgi:hypothetical protein